MKPYGRKTHHHNFPDNHPSKGYVNWWEAEIPAVKSKKKERQRAVVEIGNYEEEIYYGDINWNEDEDEVPDKCKGCIHFEENFMSYCHLFGKRFRSLTQKEKETKCRVFDPEIEIRDEIQRIEAKSW